MEFIIDWDEELAQAGRKIVLFVDNFGAHILCRFDKVTKKRIVLYEPKNIEIIFLPKNSTSITQPLDMGIIKNLKDKYKGALLKKRIESIDGGKEWKFDLLDALRLVKKAWDDVKPETIRNCFKHAKFIKIVCFMMIKYCLIFFIIG